MAQIDIRALVDLFKESIGIEAAEKTVYEAIRDANLPKKNSYNEEEFNNICDAFKKKSSPIVRIIATVASSSKFKDFYYEKELAKERKEKEELMSLSAALEQKVQEKTQALKEAQAQMVQAAKMAAVGQLSAGVAHEINNPLGGILGYAQFVLTKIARPEFSIDDFKACRKYLEYIEKECQRCKLIVENLLNFSRKSSEKFEPVDVKSTIESILFILKHPLELQNIKVTIEYAPQLPAVFGNTNQLQQVFTNIIINAKNAMPSGGQLLISGKVVEQEENKKVAVIFEDTGCGIPKQDLEKIFEPFFTTKQDAKSLGLGMSICYQIIKEHNGQILIESQPGKGAKITVILPCGSKP
ncbi:MAG: ATP-binding protein [Candidatus Omnitrophota bacterium]